MASKSEAVSRLQGLQLNFDPCNFQITNKNLLELHSIKGTSTINDLSVVRECSTAFIRNKISIIKRKAAKLRGKTKVEFLDEMVQFHARKQPEPSTSTPSTKNIETTPSEMLERLQELDKKHLQEISNLKLQRRQLKRKTTSLQNVIQNKRARYQKIYTKSKLDHQKATKAIDRMKHLNERKTEVEKEITNLHKQNKILTKSNENFLKQIKSLSQELDTRRQQIVDLKEQLEVEEELNNSIAKEKEELKDEITYIESQLQDSEPVSLVDDRNIYTNSAQLYIMNLLSEGVGIHHINNVIKHSGHMFGKEIKNLPSITTINRIADQRASVSYAQMSQDLAVEEDTCLQSDETRKHGECFEVFAVRDKNEKHWVLGLKDMINKSSDNCLNTLKKIVGDISDSTKSNAGNMILSNINNTMSDRAATEKKFHQLLENYRDEILPVVYSNWEELSLEEQGSLSHMNNFYCGLHILVNMAEVSATVVKTFEDNIKKEALGAEANKDTAPFIKKEESGSVRLIRTACKCLARGADEKSGCYLEFKTFMNEKDEREKIKKSRSSLLVPFRGNRFNIMFYNAEIVFYLSDSIKEFFTSVNTPTNRLQKAVLYDVQEHLYLGILKALGLCSKLVTAPFWRTLEQKNCTLEETNTAYQTLLTFLETSKDNCIDFMCGDLVPFEDKVKKNEIYERLIEVDVFDDHTVVVLQQIFTAWYTLLIKAASDHLQGGKFTEIEGSASVPRHNKFPESVFALLDSLTRFRPVATTLCNESYIMFSLNKTGGWLNALPEEERNNFLDMSRHEGREIRQKYIDRTKEIEHSRRESQRKKREQMEKKEQEELLHREELVNSMLFYGLWQFPETVKQMLKTIKTEKEKRQALKTQIQFRKTILGQKHSDKKIFQQSEKGKMYSIEKLTENVKTLIQSALSMGSANTTNNIFLGKRIKHFMIEEDQRKAYIGRVISSVPGYPDWFNVIYEGDEAVYAYRLADDYAKGDLEMIVEGANVDHHQFVQCMTVDVKLFNLSI